MPDYYIKKISINTNNVYIEVTEHFLFWRTLVHFFLEDVWRQIDRFSISLELSPHDFACTEVAKPKRRSAWFFRLFDTNCGDALRFLRKSLYPTYFENL